MKDTASVGRRPRRLWLYAPYAAALLLFAGYSVYWHIVANELTGGVNAWVDARRAEGWTVEHSGVRAQGYPFFMRAVVERPKISSPSASWSAPLLRIDTLPYDLSRLILSAKGAQQVSIAQPDGKNIHIQINAQTSRASLSAKPDGGWRAAADLRDAAVSGPGVSFRFGRFVIDALAQPETDAFSLSAMLRDIAATGAKGEVSQIAAALDVTHISALSGDDPVASWRAAGGELVLDGGRLEAGGGALVLRGTARLDSLGRPAGAIETRASNGPAIGAALTKAGFLTANQGAQGGLALGILTAAQKAGAPAEITLRDGAAFFGERKLADLPPVGVKK